jgi:hypothetical protein
MQQNTIASIREQIKPRPLPDYSKLYVPPDPGASPHEVTPNQDQPQNIEIRQTYEIEGERTRGPSDVIRTEDDEDGDELVQGADGGFVRKSTLSRRRREGATRGNVPQDESADGLDNLTPAQRRKKIMDDFVKINGPDPKPGGSRYRRRRMW